jgi:hypothetical protein
LVPRFYRGNCAGAEVPRWTDAEVIVHIVQSRCSGGAKVQVWVERRCQGSAEVIVQLIAGSRCRGAGAEVVHS